MLIGNVRVLCWLAERQSGTFGWPVGTPGQDVKKPDCPA